MRAARFNDAHRFRLSYVRATHSRAPGYLRRRFDKYAPGWSKPPEKAENSPVAQERSALKVAA